MSASFRESGAVLLTRGAGAEREVFLVERAPELSSFGGYRALPGGVVEESDRRGGDAAGLADEETAVGRCALRELEEETGVRVRGEGALRRLRRLGRVMTPPLARVRYRATDYHLELPDGETARARPGELTAGEFLPPERVLAEWRAGERRLVPPLVHLFETWARVAR